MNKMRVQGTFPNAEIALRMYLELMISNCSGNLICKEESKTFTAKKCLYVQYRLSTPVVPNLFGLGATFSLLESMRGHNLIFKKLQQIQYLEDRRLLGFFILT